MRPITFLLGCCLWLCTSCISDFADLSEADIELSKEITVGIPLLTGCMTLEDLLSAQDLEALDTTAQGLYQLRYRRESLLADGTSLLGLLEDAGIHALLVQTQADLSAPLPSGRWALPLDTPTHRYRQLQVKQGALLASLLTQQDAHAKLLLYQGTTPIDSVTTMLSAGLPLSISLPLDGRSLDGSRLSAALQLPDGIVYSCQQIDLQLSLAACELWLAQPLQLPDRPAALSLPIDILPNTPLSQTVSFKAPQIGVQLSTASLGARSQLRMQQLVASGPAGTQTLVLPSSTLTLSPTAQAARDSSAWQWEQDMPPLLSQRPQQLSLHYEIGIALPAQQWLYISPEGQARQRTTVNVPLEIQASGISFSRSFPMQERKDQPQLQDLREAVLQLRLYNGLPLGADITLLAYQYDQLTATIPLGDPTLEAARVDGQGNVLQPEQQDLQIALNQAQAQALFQADRIELKGTFYTTADRHVRIYRQMSLRCDAGLRAKGRVRTP